MATLDKKPHPGDWHPLKGETSDAYSARLRALFDALPKEALVRFPVADGYAFYVVTRVSPPRLQHVPYGDGYKADPALIRGLREIDVRALIEREKSLAALFRR